MPYAFDLLVVGDANPDIVLGPLDAPLAFGQREQLVDAGHLTLGGSAAIMACGAARLGLNVAFAGRVGDDDAGRFVRAALEERGVDTSALRVDPALATPLTTVLVRPDGDRAILTAPGTLAVTGPDDVPAHLLASVRHVHAASYFLLPELAPALPELFAAAHAHGATTSLDTNDDPAGRWTSGTLDATLAVTDVLLPNAREATVLAAPPAGVLTTVPAAHSVRAPGPAPALTTAGASVTSPREAAAMLAARGPCVVVKDGADGCFAHDGERVHEAAALPVRPVDTVGAGDSFDAGFVAGRLRGLSVARSLQLASVCGSLSTQAHGGTRAQPTWDEAHSALAPEGKNL